MLQKTLALQVPAGAFRKIRAYNKSPQRMAYSHR
jgi:hypothetical protein